jgi:hypothetical protein
MVLTPVAFAVVTRSCVILWSIIVSHFTSPFDSSQELLFQSFTGVRTGADRWIQAHLSQLASWDGAYFMHIAMDGYTSEKQHAFFPLYPLCMRAMRYAPAIVCPQPVALHGFINGLCAVYSGSKDSLTQE